jgi:predicted nuclease with TOPRIM domain
MQINSCLISKYSQSKAINTVPLTKEKNIKEKLNQIVEKLESINEIRSNVSKNTKFLEQNCSKFYDQAKQVFKDMKKTRNQRLDELNNLGVFNQGAFNNIKSLNNQFNYNVLSNANNFGNLQVDLQLQMKAKEIKSSNNNNIYNNSDDEYNSDGFNKVTGSPIRQMFNIADMNLNEENHGKNKLINNTNSNFFNQQNKKRFTTDDNFNRGFALTGFEENKNRTSNLYFGKEENKINERIDSLKKANSSLINELKSLQQNYVNIKFENLCLKEKLDKFSNGNNNENEIENINDNIIFSERNNDFLNGKSANQRSFSKLIF